MPFGTWSFRARLGGNHARTCARAPSLAAAAGPGSGSGPGSGPGPGSGLGLGSLPGLVLFESGFRVVVIIGRCKWMLCKLRIY